jgi:hypothetical protein
MRVNPLLAPALFIVILLGTIAIAQLTGGWIISGRTTINTGELAIDDIKGWMTLQQVMDGVRISKEDLYALVNLPSDIPTTTALKDLESVVPDFETSTLRDALTKHQETAPVSTTKSSSISNP